MKLVTLYVCEGCGAEYRSQREAEDCEARWKTARPRFKVGDIVTAKAGFGWYDGDRRWIVNARKVDPKATGHPYRRTGKRCPNGDTNCFGSCCTFQFYYVVTAIDEDNSPNWRPKHLPRYHLRTLAMSDQQGHAGGYTFEDGHYGPQKVKRAPAHVRETSRKLLGKKTEWLL